MNNLTVYKAHRIHTSTHMSGLWTSMIVRTGKRQPPTKDSLTDTVTRVPCEYGSEADALQAAKQYIDEHSNTQHE